MSRKRLDITDEIFGRLQAIVTDWYKTKQTGLTHWFCQCECGDIVSVNIADLKRGHTQSCGCLQKERISKKCREDLTGQRFDRWFVNSYNPEKSKEMGRAYWDCTCDCGTIDCISADSLKSGHSKSCGCLRRLDITDEIFGRLQAIVTDWYKTKQTGQTHWFCQCEDNNIVSVQLGALRNGVTKSCGCLKKEIVSELNLGENNHFWKGGITPLNHKIRNSIKNKEYREQIFERDNYMCQFFNKQGVELQVHHIKPFYKILEENNITTLEEAENCEELWDEDNAIVLSEEWHMGIKTDNPNAFHRLYGTKNFTEEDFYEWFNEFNFSGRKLGPKK